MFSIISILLALLGLGFLVFIHELGHYFMAKRVGMRVETFSIGFGKPIYSWEWDGTKWQIGWLFFGGFVKIAGTDGTDERDPYEIPDGFFGKSPWARIKVALMGPVANFIFAVLVFGMLFATGGRTKSFSEFTHKIGWIDPESELYAHGVRPGDEIIKYGDRDFRKQDDHLSGPILGGSPLVIDGYHVNYDSGKKVPFSYTVESYSHPLRFEKQFLTAGVLQSAQYLIYDEIRGANGELIFEGSSMKESGIQLGDRIVWADGEPVFSQMHLSQLINDGMILVTVEREGRTFLARVPRVQVDELRPNAEFREEMEDWQYDAGLNRRRLNELYTIPYNLTHDCIVEGQLRFIDPESEEDAFPEPPRTGLESPLQKGDRILAVQGVPVDHSSEMLASLQERRVLLIVQRNANGETSLSWDQADKAFDEQIDYRHLNRIARSVGNERPVLSSGDLRLLKPVKPKRQEELLGSKEKRAAWKSRIQDQVEQIATINDPEERAWKQSMLDRELDRLYLGISLQDEKVQYNPDPAEQFFSLVDDIVSNLTALVTGSISPKFFSGPVGIVHMQSRAMVGIKEAFYWLAMISLNLGVLNLLPIPVLDGGTIMLSLAELVTGRRMKPKVLERLIIPFAILLIGFFVYLTYNDLLRIFGRFFG